MKKTLQTVMVLFLAGFLSGHTFLPLQAPPSAQTLCFQVHSHHQIGMEMAAPRDPAPPRESQQRHLKQLCCHLQNAIASFQNPFSELMVQPLQVDWADFRSPGLQCLDAFHSVEVPPG